MVTERIITTPAGRWSGGVVYGLGGALDDALILNRPLSQWREAHGATVAEPGETIEGPALVVGEDVWVSRRLGEYVERAARAQTEGQIARLVRDPEGPGALCDPLGRLERVEGGGGIAFDVWYVPRGRSVVAPSPDQARLPEALADAAAVELEFRTFDAKVPVDPEATGRSEMLYRLGPVAAVPVSHWVELHRANLLAIGAASLEHGTARGLMAVLWAVVRAMSVQPNKVMARMTQRGKRCRIHPTAVVEACILGDDVHIDAGAVLRGCVVGDGARVGIHATSEFSVIGAGCRVLRQGMVNLAVLYPGARAGGVVQMGVMGRDACVKVFALGIDMRLGKPVRVETPDGLRDVDTGYMGVCFGHGSFTASGVWIAPGRVLEPGRRVLRPPEGIVR